MPSFWIMRLTALSVALINTGAVAAPAAGGGDPLIAVFRSLHLGPRARIAAVAGRNSCEAGDLAEILHAKEVVSLERADLTGTGSVGRCAAEARVRRTEWPSSVKVDPAVPVRDLDLLWMAGGYHQLYAALPAAQMTALVRALAASLSSGGALVIADRLPPSGVDPMKAATAGSIDPQIVMEQVEAAGLRLWSFANDAGVGANGRTLAPASRFVMVFRSAHARRSR